MTIRKCPKCEVNYIKDDEQVCSICLREIKHSIRDTTEGEEMIIICTECGETPAMYGTELCAECLKEKNRQTELESAVELDTEFERIIAADEAEEGEEQE